MIYFIKAGNHIKVGYTKDEKTFKVRLNTYKTSNPFEIEVISIIEGGVELEKNILNYFIKYHCKGEWFYYSENIIFYAKNPFIIPESKFWKPLKDGNKIIMENLPNIIKEYQEGSSLRELAEKYKTNRGRLTKYIPEDIRRGVNDWFKSPKRLENLSRKKVMCIETSQIFSSVTEASTSFNISNSCINKVCTNRRKQAKGFTFKYVE